MAGEKFPENPPGQVPLELASDAKTAGVQKVYEQTLKFQTGQSVTVYVGSARHVFSEVSSLRVNIADSFVIINCAAGAVIFRNWDGIGVGSIAQPTALELRSMT